MSTTQQVQSEQEEKTPSSNKRITEYFAEKYSVKKDFLLHTLKTTVFSQGKNEQGLPIQITDAQCVMLLIVAKQYNLNPFTREIYAFPDKKSGGIIPVVGVDGWSRIVNDHPLYDGAEFRYSEQMIKIDDNAQPCFEWIECVMYHKNRKHPTVVREYLDEIYRPAFEGFNRATQKAYTVNGPWQSHTKRFARHKTFIQCGRMAFGFSGIYDEDEAKRIIDVNDTPKKQTTGKVIEFDSSPKTLPENQPESVPMDLPLSDAEFEPVVQHKQTNQSDAMNVETEHEAYTPSKSMIKTAYGHVSEHDDEMIKKLVNSALMLGTWEVAKDSFKERFNRVTYQYACAKLNEAIDLSNNE